MADAVNETPIPRPVTDPPPPTRTSSKRCFIVKNGDHIADGKTYSKGDKFYSDEDLHTRFPNKFEPRDAYGAGNHDPELVPSDPGKVPDHVRAADMAHKSDVVASTENRTKPESKAERLARLGAVDDQSTRADRADEDDSDDEAAEVKIGALGEDVSDSYPDALKADLKVFVDGEDGSFKVSAEDDDEVALESFATKAALKKYLKAQVKKPA